MRLPAPDGVFAFPRKVIPDERGRVMELLRNDSPEFSKFGQVYMTSIMPGVVKGWHYHKIQTDHVACVSGMIKLVLYEQTGEGQGRPSIFHIGEHNPVLVTIPPGIWHGWKCISEREAIVVCVASEPYNYDSPDEYRMPPHGGEIPYSWEGRDG